MVIYMYITVHPHNSVRMQNFTKAHERTNFPRSLVSAGAEIHLFPFLGKHPSLCPLFHLSHLCLCLFSPSLCLFLWGPNEKPLPRSFPQQVLGGFPAVAQRAGAPLPSLPSFPFSLPLPFLPLKSIHEGSSPGPSVEKQTLQEMVSQY